MRQWEWASLSQGESRLSAAISKPHYVLNVWDRIRMDTLVCYGNWRRHSQLQVRWVMKLLLEILQNGARFSCRSASGFSATRLQMRCTLWRRGILYFPSITQLHDTCINVISCLPLGKVRSSLRRLLRVQKCSTALCTHLFYWISPKSDMKHGKYP
jgi:hypothetical protein